MSNFNVEELNNDENKKFELLKEKARSGYPVKINVRQPWPFGGQFKAIIIKADYAEVTWKCAWGVNKEIRTTSMHQIEIVSKDGSDNPNFRSKGTPMNLGCAIPLAIVGSCFVACLLQVIFG